MRFAVLDPRGDRPLERVDELRRVEAEDLGVTKGPDR
jgi:hypothetical protein